MRQTTTVGELREVLRGAKNIAFVPTMGALHDGHLALVARARELGQTVVVSVFVNPTQFNDKGDLAKYPRTLAADAALLAAAGVDVLFAPSVDEIYPDGVDVAPDMQPYASLIGVMEGAQRPGHFEGVVQVVGRLFDLVQPDKAIFGEKDFQQLAIIRAMVSQQGRAVEIIGHPIVRGADGLALSSRNALLGADERAAAPLIYKELCALKAEIEKNKALSIAKLLENAVENLKNNRYLCPEYIECVDSKTLQSTSDRLNFRLCAAVRCGSIRLIDNI